MAFRAGCTDASGSWGAAPSVFWFLLYAQKERPGGEPYRLCTLHILRDAFRRPQTIPCRVGIQILISKRPRPAARRLPTWSRISSAAHSSANRSPCRLAVPEKIFALLACSIFSTAADAPPRCIRHWRRSAPHSHPPRPPHPPQICIINPSLTSPIKPTIYAILAQ